MSATAANESSSATRYRLVVRSAAEAVKLLRDRFGESARVLSVRQLEAGGLARFLQRPRLEVIVEAGSRVPMLDATSADIASPVAPEAEAAGALVSAPQEPAPALKPRLSAGRVISVLRATGLDESILERVRADRPEIDWDRAAAQDVLAHLGAWLRRQFEALPKGRPGARRVFLGACGAGKTTVLCKLLAADVFVHGTQPAVLKLEGDLPNATDGLAAFCEVLGAPLLRSAVELEEVDPAVPVYVDVPGMGLDSGEEHRRLRLMLDALQVDVRILVVNAAWESEVIAAAFEMGRACGATDVCFTHLDEVRRPAKLWRFVFSGGLPVRALASGPSPAGELDENIFGALLARTIPPGIAQGAGSRGGQS
jgi:flagellar biosynthesis protein FlhF